MVKYFEADWAPERIREQVVCCLNDQGFVFENNKLSFPEGIDKDFYRAVNRSAVAHKRIQMGKALKRKEEHLLKSFIANGKEVQPEAIKPKLHMIQRKSELELLFRYAYCHWSIPVSAGYGRRIRYAVMDENNGKLIGIIGLCDPVYSLKSRDSWIGWDKQAKKENIASIMDAFVLGAVPPYNMLLGGKLTASLCYSSQIYQDFRAQYGSKQSLISDQRRDYHLAIITTASALGRSSVYNRLKIPPIIDWRPLGYTKGSGEFHFSNGMYNDIFKYVSLKHTPKLKNSKWGKGWRNKREVIKAFLSDIGLPQSMLYHGIKRQIYAATLGSNSLKFLQNSNTEFSHNGLSSNDISRLALKRWVVPRAKRDTRYLEYSNDQYRLWNKGAACGN